MATNKLADTILDGWIDALNELVDDGLISPEAGDKLFERSQELCATVAERRGTTDEFISFAQEVSDDEAAKSAQAELVLN